MARYIAWKTIIDGAEKKHRSETKTYEWLRAQAADLPDGTRIAVLVQEQHAGDRWYTFENMIVRSGTLGDA
jgi:hypothetical protein